MRCSQLLDHLLVLPDTLVPSSLEYLEQPLILFLELPRDFGVLRLDRPEVIPPGDFEVGHLLDTPLPLLRELAQVVLEHLHVVRLVLLDNALHADTPPAGQAIGLTLVALV